MKSAGTWGRVPVRFARSLEPRHGIRAGVQVQELDGLLRVVRLPGLDDRERPVAVSAPGPVGEDPSLVAGRAHGAIGGEDEEQRNKDPGGSHRRINRRRTSSSLLRKEARRARDLERGRVGLDEGRVDEEVDVGRRGRAGCGLAPPRARDEGRVRARERPVPDRVDRGVREVRQDPESRDRGEVGIGPERAREVEVPDVGRPDPVAVEQDRDRPEDRGLRVHEVGHVLLRDRDRPPGRALVGRDEHELEPVAAAPDPRAPPPRAGP